MSSNHHTPIPAGTAADVASMNAPLGQLDSKLSGLLAGSESLGQLNLTAGASALAVSSNAITIVNSIHVIDTSGGSVTINTINGSLAGDILILSISNTGNTATLTTAGNILLRNGQSVILRNVREYMIFVYRNLKWNEIGSSPLEFWSLGGTSPFFPGGFYLPTNILTDSSGRLPRLEVMPNLAKRNSWSVRANNNAFVSNGIAAVSTQGTLSEASNANTTYINCLSGAVSGNGTGIFTATYNYVHIENSPEWSCVIETGGASDIANVRLWAGLTSNGVTNADDLTAGTKAIMFRYSSATDSSWATTVDDGGAIAAASTGVSFSVNTQYLLRIRVNWSLQLAYFSINGGSETSISVSALSGTKMGFAVFMYTTAAAAKNLLISRVYCEHN